MFHRHAISKFAAKVLLVYNMCKYFKQNPEFFKHFYFTLFQIVLPSREKSVMPRDLTILT